MSADRRPDGTASNRLAQVVTPLVATATAWWVAAVLLPQGAPVSRVMSGAVLGSASALTAVGLVLVFRARRIVNFAQGAMGGATGLIAVKMFLSWGWPYGAALALGILGGLVVGAAVEVLIIRRFESASPLVLSVATIGLAQLLGGLELVIPPAIFGADGVSTLGGYETPLSAHRFGVGSEFIDGNHILIVAVTAVVGAGLALFLSRTRVGIGIRASADNAERALLLGIPVRRLQTIVWSLAGGLATLTYVLAAPFSGTPPSAAGGVTVLLPALAAAVVARMRSLGVAAAAAVAIGAIDQVVRWNVSRTPAVADVVLLVVIVMALLVQQRGSRVDDIGSESLAMGTTPRPLSRAFRRMPTVRVGRWILGALGVVAAVAAPSLMGVTAVNTLSIAVVWAMVALSVVVLTGWAGQISLGQFALVGVGAVMAGNLVMRWNVDYLAAIVASALTAGLVALALGLPALRIRGPFLGVVTLAFAVVLDSFVLNPNVFPSLIPDRVDRPVLLQRWRLEDERISLWFCLALLAGVASCVRALRHRRSGRLMIAVRDNESAAEAMGVPPLRVKLGGFVASGCVAGAAGALHVMVLHGARVNSYQPADSIDIFSIVTAGGVASPGGATTAAAGLRSLRDEVSPGLRLVLMGVGVLVVLMVMPGGLASLAANGRDRFLSALSRRRGVDLRVGAGGDAADTREAGTDAAPRIAGSDDNQADVALRCCAVDVSYGSLQVLFGVGLAVHRGEVVTLLGTNGAGKSTLLKALSGLTPSSGVIELWGEPAHRQSTGTRVEAGLALMLGGRSVFPNLSVDENLHMAAWTFHRDHARVRESIDEAYRLFDGLAERSRVAAGRLSGGEQQQLALAQTLMLKPSVVLIDELSLGLSPSLVGELMGVVRDMNESGTTVVIVEQSVNVALELADRAVFMEKGQVRFDGPAKELADRPDLLRSVFLSGAGGSPPTHDVGTPCRQIDHPEADEPAPALSISGLTVSFGGVTALSGIDLDVSPGEIVGLIGQNGAGKTTLVNCASGFLRPDSGTVELLGADVTRHDAWRRARAGLGRTFQNARLFPSLTVAETLAVAHERHVSSRSMVADAFRQPAAFESELVTAAGAEGLLTAVGLLPYRDTLVGDLSTGTRRLVELACLMAGQASVMLLDEPSAGVAQKEAEALGPLLRQLRDDTGATMVVVEHDMAFLAGLCDRLVAMDLGRIIAQGPPSQVLADERVVAAYLGTDETAIGRSGTRSHPTEYGVPVLPTV